MSLFRLLSICILGSLLYGCTSQEAGKPVVKAVEEYCSIVQVVYSRLDLAPLARVATEKEIRRVYPVVQALTAADNVMKTEIEDFKVTSVKVADAESAATVDTSERWKFWWEDRRTGTVTKSAKVESYKLRYMLVREKDSWKVDQVKNL